MYDGLISIQLCLNFITLELFNYSSNRSLWETKNEDKIQEELTVIVNLTCLCNIKLSPQQNLTDSDKNICIYGHTSSVWWHYCYVVHS